MWKVILLTVIPFLGAEVCYDHIGCFSNSPPFTNSFGKLPLSPNHIGTTFHLHTRKNPKAGELLNPNGDATSVTSTHFNAGHKTAFIIHGWHGIENDTWIELMTAALLKNFDMNVIVVVWTRGAYDDYNQAVADTRVVGAITANMVRLLHSSTNMYYSNIHLIGHSLGAHICGYVGDRVPGIGRITGLDPAGPDFNHVNTKVRLDTSDALFVDVIHSDGVLGFHNRMGQVDFFPNGGRTQPGCAFDPIAPFYSCSHMRAPYYFIESINPNCHFGSYHCNSYNDYRHNHCHSCTHGCVDMGYYLSSHVRGTFYLKTGWHFPYCSH